MAPASLPALITKSSLQSVQLFEERIFKTDSAITSKLGLNIAELAADVNYPRAGIQLLNFNRIFDLKYLSMLAGNLR